MLRSPWLAATVVLVAGIASAADHPTAAVGKAMSTAANDVIATLTPAEKAKVVKSFDDPGRVDWHNIPKPERKGLQIREMKAATRDKVQQLLKVSLSEEGYEKAQRIMALESNLREGEKSLTGSPLRDPERYFLSIFGQPGVTGQWGWSFEGHHLSLNFVIQDSAVISDSPSFWGANPATVHLFVPGGPEKGVRTLAKEEQIAFDLLDSLNDAQRSKAIISGKAPSDYRAAGQAQPPKTAQEGVPARELNDAQKKTLQLLLENYVGHLAKPLAEVKLAQLKADGWEQVYFAWAGSTKPGVGHYYRVEGPSFVLELVNVQSDPQGNVANHIHSVWRNPKGDFGLAAK